MGSLPRLGDDWSSIKKLLQEGIADLDEYDEFDSYDELVDFIHGIGDYGDRRSFRPGEEDLDEQSLAGHQAEARCPQCVDEIENHKYNPDIDPRMEVSYNVVEQDAHFKDDADTRYTGFALVYCQRHAEESYFQFEDVWYE